MAMFQAPKGVPDYVPPRSGVFVQVQRCLADPVRRAGYSYIELPVFEDTGLFVRGVGESTDVVTKEMYTFTDRGDRSLTLRPEGTAGVMRAVAEHGLERGQLPIKLWYQGPFFRAERPQQGRYRQLQQVGAEALGSDDPALDAEVIALAAEGFVHVGLRDWQLQLTSLGCADCRAPYRALLQEYLADCDLDDDTRKRAERNPLRVLDDKRETVQHQLRNAPLIADALCSDCREHYAHVREYLAALDVAWVEAPRMVRGLDYYTRTTFEFVHAKLGAQSGIGGGGRYDGLMQSIGGSDLTGIGFGLGVDRTILAAEAEGIEFADESTLDVCCVALDPADKGVMLRLCQDLRGVGLRADLVFGDRSLKSAMKAAHRLGAPITLLIGPDERAGGIVQLKVMESGEQRAIPHGEVVAAVIQERNDRISS